MFINKANAFTDIFPFISQGIFIGAEKLLFPPYMKYLVDLNPSNKFLHRKTTTLLQRLEMALFTLNEVNRNDEILPGVKLFLLPQPTCHSNSVALSRV